MGNVMINVKIEDKEIVINRPDKLLWSNPDISKKEYILKIAELAPYIIKYAKDRHLTTIRYPDGAGAKSFFQKSIPSHAPSWIDIHAEDGEDAHLLLNNLPTLTWLCSQAALEFHLPFNDIHTPDYPDYLVFDLDPSQGQDFDFVREAAIRISETLKALNIISCIKTSGATGLQIYIPDGKKYAYTTARNINEFFAKYFSQKFPKLITIERLVTKRSDKLYFDYLQMWTGKTIIAPYSPRATKQATVSMPVKWEELSTIKPTDFNLFNAAERLKSVGDLFEILEKEDNQVALEQILKHATH